MSANEYENYQSNSNTSSTTDSNSGDLDDKTLLEEYQKATLRNVNSQNKKKDWVPDEQYRLLYVYFKDIVDTEKAYLCAIPAYNTGIGNVSKTLSGTCASFQEDNTELFSAGDMEDIFSFLDKCHAAMLSIEIPWVALPKDRTFILSIAHFKSTPASSISP